MQCDPMPAHFVCQLNQVGLACWQSALYFGSCRLGGALITLLFSCLFVAVHVLIISDVCGSWHTFLWGISHVSFGSFGCRVLYPSPPPKQLWPPCAGCW